MGIGPRDGWGKTEPSTRDVYLPLACWRSHWCFVLTESQRQPCGDLRKPLLPTTAMSSPSTTNSFPASISGFDWPSCLPKGGGRGEKSGRPSRALQGQGREEEANSIEQLRGGPQIFSNQSRQLQPSHDEKGEETVRQRLLRPRGRRRRRRPRLLN